MNPKQDSIISATLACFQHILKRHLLFHLIFASMAVGSLLLFIVFFSFLAESFFLAIAIACFFFACVMYFVGKLYLQEQKPQQFLSLRSEYLAACMQEDVAEAARVMASFLECDRLTFYPSFPYVEKAARFFVWQDVHRMKELFLLAAIDEHIARIKSHPTSFEAHQAVASAYTQLARHYVAPLSKQTASPYVDELKQKFRLSAERAIEELNILKEYAPQNPWVRKQLAIQFRELKMPEREIEEYEALVQMTQADTDAELLLKLGTLYFSQGHNAKGLKVYDQLKNNHPQEAQALIQHYGSTL